MTKMEKTSMLVIAGGVLLEILFCFLSILSVFGTADKTIGTTFLTASLTVGVIGIGTIVSGIYFLRVSNNMDRIVGDTYEIDHRLVE